MSEREPISAEFEPKREVEKSPEKHHKHAEREHKPERKLENVEHLKHQVEQEAISREKVSVESSKSHHQPRRIDKELKAQTYQRTLTRIRKKLSAPERVFSRIAQQPVVDRLSQVGEKTIARPVSLFSGALCAFIGTSVAFFMARRYGFSYNFLLFALLFAGGFVLGLVAELLVRTLRRIGVK